MICNDGYFRVSGAVPTVKPGDIQFNTSQIIACIEKAAEEGTQLVAFPELCVTGYTCADLFGQRLLLDSTLEAVRIIREATVMLDITAVIGAPILLDDALYNCAIVISGGYINGIVPKTHLPNYNEFYEKRWFQSGKNISSYFSGIFDQGDIPFGTDLIFRTHDGIKFGIEICEDLWVPNPPSVRIAMAGADLIVNLSASNEVIGKHRYLRNLILNQSGALRCAYLYVSAGQGESSTDLVFSGNVMIAENGTMLAETDRFGRDTLLKTCDIDIDNLRHDRQVHNSFFDDRDSKNGFRVIQNERIIIGEKKYPKDILRQIDPHPFVPADPNHLQENCREIIAIQSWGLEQRLLATGCKRLVIGISGGLDSTLALLVAVNAFRRLGLPLEGIYGITMPGEATSNRTHSNANGLMEVLGVTQMEIPINPAVAQHFKDIDQDPQKHDAAYENSQARERTQILMDMANKVGGMVLGTGDLSELALGWCTYNGDHMSMYAVNASVPKTLVKYLVQYFALTTDNEKEREILLDIIDTPISPELIPSKDEEIGQKTEDLVGPYELHDFFLYHTLRFGATPKKIYRMARKAFEGVYEDEVILHWIKNFYRRFFSQQFKRSCMPDGPKVGSVCLSPRGDWRMPSDASSKLWLAEAEALSNKQ